MTTSRIVSLILLAGMASVLVSCSNPADSTPEAVVSDVEPSTAPPAAEGQRLTFAESSTIEFTGSKITGSHNGGFRSFDGEIVLVDNDPVASRVSVTIDTTSLWSDNDRLTGHLKSPDFFDVEVHPTARFTSVEITKADDGYRVAGDLELHGVTKRISFPASIEVSDDGVTARAEFHIKRYDFGIEYPGKPDDLIRDEVVIRLNLLAKPAEVAS